MPHTLKTILIVDADLLSREALKRVLSDEYRNIEFGVARNAEEALACLKLRPWRFVILDVTLPDNDGFFVLQEVRRHRPESAVLVRSIHGESVHSARSLRLGAAGYISKTPPVPNC
jgi:DNA-binding NarL/FixJ family response regulator